MTPSHLILVRFSTLTLSILIVLAGARLLSRSAALPVAAQAERVRFVDLGDFGLAGSTEAAVATLVKSWQPEFIVTNGDDNYQLGGADTIDANIGQYYHDYIFPYVGNYGPGATENRFWPALGDHDWLGISCTGNNCTGPYFDYFTLPGNERYYDLVKGPVHLFIINSNTTEPDGNTATSVQANWLRTQLAAATEPWKIVITQHPPYSSGSVHGSIPALQWPYKAWGATVVLSGNEHNYERLTVDGLPYIVNGAGGVGLYGFATPLPGSEVRYNADYGALLIDATDQTITFQFINTAGAVIDTLTLDHAAGPTSTPTGPTSTPEATVTTTPEATATPPALLPAAGLRYQYYEGEWSSLQDLDTATPLSTGVVNNFNLSADHCVSNFAFRFSGCLTVASSDLYTFSVNTDGSTQLDVDGIRVMDKAITLAAGVHAMEATYLRTNNAGGQGQNSGSANATLEVSYQGPNLAKGSIPDAALTQNNCRIPPGGQYRYVRFVAKSEVHGNAWAAMAEFDLFDGNWNYIPKKSWHTTYADSEEFTNGEGYAPYAIDDDPYTDWRTEYINQQPGFPHELRIDLGANYTLSTFRYLPRQDSDNGRIADYEFYVSQDGVDWGEPVAQGSFPNTPTAQEVDFSNYLAQHDTLNRLFMPLIHSGKP